MKNSILLLFTAVVFFIPAFGQKKKINADSAAIADSVRNCMYQAALLSMDAMQAKYKSQQPDGKGGVTINEQKAGEAQNLFAQSRTFYRKAIAFNPAYCKAWSNLGTTYYLEGQVKDAIPYFRKSVNIDGHYAAGWFNLGLAYDKTGMRDSAKFSLGKCIGSDSGYVLGYQELSRIYIQEEKDSAGALRMLRLASVHKPDSELPWNSMAAIYLQYGDTARSVAATEKAALINPNNYDRLDFLARYFLLHRDVSKYNYYIGLAEAARERVYIPPDPEAGKQ